MDSAARLIVVVLLAICALFVLMPVLPRPKRLPNMWLSARRREHKLGDLPATYLSNRDRILQAAALPALMLQGRDAISAADEAGPGPGSTVRFASQLPRRPVFRARPRLWWWRFLATVAADILLAPSTASMSRFDNTTLAAHPGSGMQAQSSLSPRTAWRFTAWDGLALLAVGCLLVVAAKHVLGSANTTGSNSATSSRVSTSGQGISTIRNASSTSSTAPLVMAATRFLPPAATVGTIPQNQEVIALHVRLFNSAVKPESLNLGGFTLLGVPSSVSYTPQFYAPLLDTLLIDSALDPGAATTGDIAFYVVAGDSKFILRYAASGRNVVTLTVS